MKANYSQGPCIGSLVHVSLLLALLLAGWSLDPLRACDVDNPPRLFGKGVASFVPTPASGHTLRVLTQHGYLPAIPVLVRVEVRDASGQRDWTYWDGEATLTVDRPGVTLSTNRLDLHNGMGSALVTFTGGTNFNLVVTVGGVQTNRPMQTLTNLTVNTFPASTLVGNVNWSGVIRITGDITVPLGVTLTIQSNTLVLFNGVSSGTTAPDIFVTSGGRIQSLGTEEHPVTFTCFTAGQNWGQIRHTSALPSLYRHTSFTRGGRAAADGITTLGPLFVPNSSQITFESCNLTDARFGTNAVGKVMTAYSSTLAFTDCLLQRFGQGPEIHGGNVGFTNSYVMDIFNLDDADGIYLFNSTGPPLRIINSVIAFGDDDGFDLLSGTALVERSIIRDFCDKGVSMSAGQINVNRSLIVDSTHGISVKGDDNVTITVGVDHSTVVVATNGIAVINKSGKVGVNGIYNVTNTIIRSDLSIVTDYSPTNFHLSYSNVRPTFSGLGNTPANNAALAAIILASPGIKTNSPLFVDQVAGDFHLQAASPCIDTGHPAAPLDPDGSRTDMGYYTFLAPSPTLGGIKTVGAGSVQFALSAYTNRNYVIESSTNLAAWQTFRTVFTTQAVTTITDTNLATTPARYFKARLGP